MRQNAIDNAAQRTNAIITAHVQSVVMLDRFGPKNWRGDPRYCEFMSGNADACRREHAPAATGMQLPVTYADPRVSEAARRAFAQVTARRPVLSKEGDVRWVVRRATDQTEDDVDHDLRSTGMGLGAHDLADLLAAVLVQRWSMAEDPTADFSRERAQAVRAQVAQALGPGLAAKLPTPASRQGLAEMLGLEYLKWDARHNLAVNYRGQDPRVVAEVRAAARESVAELGVAPGSATLTADGFRPVAGGERP